ncbi:ImmA/IrrE family metallo-endopeptidase [Cohnella silvisoli]|uniref:ImmA/IrrE family metallo-endopeptidase n=1 Tax=Cohnella silvisoli TaxID=2873699 RepID=A0ABV1L365_9BACL|nr:ImmA/IrrE family metallo-endopeptidase [Cohnella silvisoli]MCD9026012.1 ImmA/IrrE family metallo-endopeptidase [Cohnella silvisoli]
MGFVRLEVQRLLKAYKTNDPLTIAAQKNITVLYEVLGHNTWGYFSCMNRIPIIHVNNKLGEFETRFTIAHELGHRILHPKLNTPFLRRNTLFSVDRIERQTNRFAIYLLIGHEQPDIGESVGSFLSRCGIPEEMYNFYS